MEEGNYGSMLVVGGGNLVVHKLVAAQVAILESTVEELWEAVGDMEASVGRMRKIYRNAMNMVQQQDKRLTLASRRMSRGPVPSIDECIDGLDTITYVV